MVGKSGSGDAEQAATAPRPRASGMKRIPSVRCAGLGDEEIAGLNLTRVHGDTGDLDVGTVKRMAQGGSQLGETDHGLGVGVGGV